MNFVLVTPGVQRAGAIQWHPYPSGRSFAPGGKYQIGLREPAGRGNGSLEGCRRYRGDLIEQDYPGLFFVFLNLLEVIGSTSCQRFIQVRDRERIVFDGLDTLLR